MAKNPSPRDFEESKDLEAPRVEKGNKILQYKTMKTLGSGWFGTVNLVEDVNGEQFAMKVIDGCGNNKSDVETEVEAMRRVGSEKLFCHLKEFSATEEESVRKYNIIMEYFEGLQLKKFIEMHNITPDHFHYILWQIGYALKTLHKNGVVHNDVKDDNILVNSLVEVRLIDFGNAKIFDVNRDKKRSHSRSEKNKHVAFREFSSDYEAVGEMLCEIFLQSLPFDLLNSLKYGKPNVVEIQRLIQEAYEREDIFYPFGIDPVEMDFLTRLLTPKNNERLNERTYFRHAIFKNIYPESAMKMGLKYLTSI